MLLQQWCEAAPAAIVCLVGIVLAISRWRRHPQVSAWIAISLVCALTSIAVQWGQLWALQTKFWYAFYGLFAFDSLRRTLSWVSMFVAIFGWRRPTVDDTGARRLQFSVRNLFALTLAVAILCGVLRGVVSMFGDFSGRLQGFIVIIPLLLVLPVGGWMAWLRRRQHPGVSWCVSGAISLEVAGWLLSLGLIIAVITGALQAMSVLPILPLLIWPAFSFLKWILLLCAAFGWRQEPIGPLPNDRHRAGRVASKLVLRRAAVGPRRRIKATSPDQRPGLAIFYRAASRSAE